MATFEHIFPCSFIALAMESIGDAVAFLSVSGEIKYVNRAFEDLYGYKAEEVVGRSVAILTHDDLNIWGGSNDIQEQAIGDGWKGGLRARTKSGDGVDVLLTTNPVRDNHGKVVGSVSVTRGVTGGKCSEERMSETARLASIVELASGVAHEINGPLASVLLFARLLLHSDAPEAIRSDIQNIYSEAQRAAAIAQNFLILARKPQPKRELADLNFVLERALEIKSADFKSSKIQISRNLSIDPLCSILDDHQLTQVFVNILTNAQQAIEYSGKDGHITLASSSSDGVIEVKITDNGSGIDPQIVGKIFEPFFTTKPAGVGTGLGLSICYGIVKGHGGDLWAEDLLGEGTAFHLRIPILLPEDRHPRQP